jgi:hypothetical protein
MSMENHGGMIPTAENSWCVHHSSLKKTTSSHLVANQEEFCKGNH